ncbi:MAG: arylsulfatase [Sedimentisphaerales bacterium]
MGRQTRREFLMAIGSLTASTGILPVLPGCAGIGRAPEGQIKQPNVVLVITDDQGYGDLSCHGNPVLETPNLDRLHSESIRLTNFHVSPTCSPTRAALMTGHYCNRTGVWHTIMGRSLLRQDEVTIADVFSASGYCTGIFGKWHLGDNYPFRPQDRGFDEVLIHGGGGVGQGPDYWGNDYFDDTYRHNGKLEKFTGYCTDIFFDGALKFIEAHKDQPFFCYLPTNAPHGPYNVADKYSRPYRDKGVGDRQANFYGMIKNIDENMGRLMQRLKELDLQNNTILIFMTDNGSSAGYSAGMRGKKGSEYDGGHRVPCFIRWPGGGLKDGRNIDRLTAHIDILPTLIELCGLNKPVGIKFDGDSLAGLLAGYNKNWPDRTLVTDSQRIEHPEKWRKSAVMTDRWRLINGRELYDIKVDPAQENNVAREYPEVVETLRQNYEDWWTDVSQRFDEYCHIIIGSDKENPTRLMSHDWHGQKVPWSQRAVRNGMQANGFWAVEVARDGTYEFALRRWPIEVDQPINAAISGGKAISATSARLKIADIDVTQPVPKNATAVTFQVRLKAGKTRLQTWFMDQQGTCRGAYYVYVKRL